MSKQIAIQISHVVKSFGDNEVIKDCSMCIEQGIIYGFLGANGAGKTTVFKLLLQIGSLIEAPAFYEHLSAQKNLEIHLEDYFFTIMSGGKQL